jgi:hypothetical protein
MKIPLAGYPGIPVGLVLADSDSPVVAGGGVGPLPPKGASGRLWQYTSRGLGLKRLGLKNLGGGQFLAKARARKWFTAAAANQPAAATTVTMIIGETCFTHAATDKLD